MREIICFGDSNTYGLIPGTTERYDADTRWTGILQKTLYKEGYYIVEEGLCGRTTIFEDERRVMRKGTDMLPTLLESHGSAERVILMLGTNDCKSVFHASPEKIGEGVEMLLKQIIDFDPSMKVLLVSPIHLGERVWEDDYDPEFDRESVETSRRLEVIYRNIAKKYEIDFFAASDVAEPSQNDMEHMDEKNHKKFADAILKSVFPVL